MRTVSMAMCVVILVSVARTDEPAKPKAEKSAYARPLKLFVAAWARGQEAELEKLQEAGEFEKAVKIADELVRVRERDQGKDHWEAVNARHTAEATRLAVKAGDAERKAYATSFAEASQAAQLEGNGRAWKAELLRERVIKATVAVVGELHNDTATATNSLANNQHMQGKYTAAEKSVTKALAIRRAVLGDDHPHTALLYYNLAYTQCDQGKYLEAEAGHTKALAIRQKILGENHSDTGSSYNDLAFTQNTLGKYDEAETNFSAALAVRQKVLGETHPSTITAMNNLAFNRDAQGKYAEAEVGHTKALAIRQKVLGDDHPETASSYNNLALNQNAQGKYAEAEAGFAKALAIYRKLLGEEHVDTARATNNLAFNQHAQGKYLEAEQSYTKALTILRKMHGDEHADVAQTSNNMAHNQDAQGKHAEAEVSFTKALTVFRKVLGEDHPSTVSCAGNLAANQIEQGKYAQAEEGLTKVLASFRKIHREDHPSTALLESNLASSRSAQGKYAEAEAGFTKVLTIRGKSLGEDHPSTALSSRLLAFNQLAQGKVKEAEANLRRAAVSFDAARLRFASSGLERSAKTAEESPLSALAVVLAHNGKPAEAWAYFEQSLGRGTLNDLSARLRRVPADLARQAELSNRLDSIDRQLEAIVSAKNPPADRDARLKELLTQQREGRDSLVTLTRTLERKYGPAVGQVFALADIQAALSPETALVGWLDLSPAGSKAASLHGEHWAFLLLPRNEPIVVRLSGTGDKDAWTDIDTSLLVQFRAAIESETGNWKPLADRLRKQRIDPLAKHLAGVKRLVVLPSVALRGVPVETFAADFTISYAPSGTLYAHLRKQARPASAGLLAVADPTFETQPRKDALLPPHGLLVTAVVAGGNAAVADIKPDDVLLQYADTKLTKRDDLVTRPEVADAKADTPVLVWRDGKPLSKPRFVKPGKLGLLVADDPAPVALATRRKLDNALARRDDNLTPLPGTRVEAESLARLFPEGKATLLADSDASEQKLLDLARERKLGEYRYLHFATHGHADGRSRLNSCLFLARDALPNPQTQLAAGKPVFDGRLSAAEVLREWHLNADLVTLSACETGLGSHEGGEGFVGFTQPMLLAGARSVVLSQWKVDDTATALLMERFYANLLGKRPELKGTPMSKVDALHEAKAWLRMLSREDALTRSATLTKGVVRGERGAGEPRRPVVGVLAEVPKVASEKETPYAHPFFWAAFVLVGDDR